MLISLDLFMRNELNQAAAFLLWLDLKDHYNPKTGEDQPILITLMGMAGSDVRAGYHLFINSRVHGYTLAEYARAKGQDRNPLMSSDRFRKKYIGTQWDHLIRCQYICSWQIEDSLANQLYSLKAQITKRMDQIKERIKILGAAETKKQFPELA